MENILKHDNLVNAIRHHALKCHENLASSSTMAIFAVQINIPPMPSYL